MFGTQWTKKKDAERITSDAWDALVSSVETAGDKARWMGRRTQHLADEASGRVGSVADEAGRRAQAAMAALAGHRPGKSWGWILGAAAGLAAGWALTVGARRALTGSQFEDDLDLPEYQPDAGAATRSAAVRGI